MFECMDEAKAQILRDKHTLLEGYVTEYLFEQQFLSRKGAVYTHGWWSAVRGETRFFFLVKEKMSVLDQKVFELLSSRYVCWRAYPIGNEWFFSDGVNEVAEWEFLGKYNFTPLRGRLTATNDTKNRERQNQCIAFFEAHNILVPVAVERNFADEFLTVYFNSMVNIDYITENSGGDLCVLEIKFKYENRAGFFGINAGQMLMFEVLERLGLVIHHMILYNHTRDKELSIFGFLNAEDGEKYWLYGILTGFSDRKKSVAPRETSVDGKNTQAYYSFGKSEITKKYPLKIFSQTFSQKRSSLTSGK